MELKQLKYFIKVSESGSFSRAAMLLDVTQPFLSRQIRRLELELRQHLFYRHGRGVLLTEAGTRFLPVAKDVLARMEQAFEETGDEQELAGKIALGVPPSLTRGLAIPLLRRFSNDYPKVSLTIAEGLSRSLHEQLLTHRLDIALLHDPSAYCLVSTIPLSTEHMCLISPKGFFPPEVESIPFSLLPELDLIFPSSPHPLRAVMEIQAKSLGFELNVAHDIDGVETILEVVQEGFGHTIASSTVVRLGRYWESLAARPITDPAVASTIMLAHDSNLPASALKRAALSLIYEVYQETLAAQ